MNSSRNTIRRQVMGFWPIAMTVFICVSGGPYGLEPVMQSGAGMGLLLILITPIVWALPAALLTAELSSALPAEGGYYVWVKRALGPMAGFFCAWLTYLYTWVDTAIYPVLFISYLKAFPFASFLNNPVYSVLATVCFIVPLVLLNIRGAHLVGLFSVLFSVLLLLPFLLMVVFGFSGIINHGHDIMAAFVPKGESLKRSFSAGLFVIMWNYLGWDSLSTIAGEIKNPQKTFPKALMIGVPIVVINYFLPALAGIAAQPDTTQWTDGSWPAIAALFGGGFLRNLMAFGGLISAAGLFMVSLLAASRIPFVLANDRILPAFLTRRHPRFGTPLVAIFLSTAIYAVLSILNFSQLAEIDVILYSSALVLEFIALVILRIREPNLPRPFKIPGGWPVLVPLVLIPMTLIGFAYYMVWQENGSITLYLLLAALASGGMVWFWRRRK